MEGARARDPGVVLNLTTAAEPWPGPDDVILEVGACALNFADGLLCQGTYQERPSLPFTPGLEVSGVVLVAGENAPHAVGDRVAGSPQLPDGGLAERCRAHSEDVFAIPPAVSHREAAAMHVSYQTAWFGLYRRARLRQGESVLINAGAGAAGSAAVQLAKAAGASVITTAGGAAKATVCRKLGADLALDHQVDNVIEAVHEFTQGRGVDVIFDPVGGSSFDIARKVIAWEGRILIIGAASGTYRDAPTNHVLVKNYSVIGLNWGGYRSRRPDLVRAAHDDIMRLYQEGIVAPLIAPPVRFDEVRDALIGLLAGQTVGKIVAEASTEA